MSHITKNTWTAFLSLMIPISGPPILQHGHIVLCRCWWCCAITDACHCYTSVGRWFRLTPIRYPDRVSIGGDQIARHVVQIPHRFPGRATAPPKSPMTIEQVPADIFSPNLHFIFLPYRILTHSATTMPVSVLWPNHDVIKFPEPQETFEAWVLCWDSAALMQAITSYRVPGLVSLFLSAASFPSLECHNPATHGVVPSTKSRRILGLGIGVVIGVSVHTDRSRPSTSSSSFVLSPAPDHKLSRSPARTSCKDGIQTRISQHPVCQPEHHFQPVLAGQAKHISAGRPLPTFFWLRTATTASGSTCQYPSEKAVDRQILFVAKLRIKMPEPHRAASASGPAYAGINEYNA